jgi:hypothetical protein
MAAGGRFELDILCPNCGAKGEAWVSDNENPGFRVDKYPEGFSEISPSACRQETKIRCACGQEFYLL